MHKSRGKVERRKSRSIEFEEAVSKVLEFEGGYVNDPQDPGKATKYGISKRSWPDVDVENLTVEGAKQIYHKHYWQRLSCDEMSAISKKIAFCFFDTAVLCGERPAVRLLQKALGTAPYAVDGKMGPKTLKALSGKVSGGRGLEVLMDFLVLRILHLAAMPHWEKYRRGWVRRAVASVF